MIADSPREEPKAARRDDYIAYCHGVGKRVGVNLSFTISIISMAFTTMNSVAWVQTVSLIFSFDWMNAIALVVIIVGGYTINLHLAFIHDGQAWRYSRWPSLETNHRRLFPQL